MGDYYDFKCEKCDFITRCSHGRDRGFVMIAQPLYCSKCKVLKNIHIGNFPKDEFGTTQLELLDRICQKCNAGEYLTKWNGMDYPSCGHFRMKHRRSNILWE